MALSELKCWRPELRARMGPSPGFAEDLGGGEEVTGGIEVSVVDGEGALRTVKVVMTPGKWDELSEVIQIESAGNMKWRLRALEDDKRFLVCDSGVELITSSSRDLPPDEAGDFTPEPRGEWVVTDEAGNVVSRFADWSDTDH